MRFDRIVFPRPRCPPPTSPAGLFWGEDSEEKAKNSLRVALANVNKVLPGSIERDPAVRCFPPQSTPHHRRAHL
jgi:hypothetical protein